MKQYRVWLTDITLQSVVVAASDAKHARKQVEELVKQGEALESFEHVEESNWEVSSIDELTD